MGSGDLDVLAIATLYRCSPFEAPALLSIKASQGAKRLIRKLFLYDNSPSAEYSADDIGKCTGVDAIVVKGDNAGGLAAAYNAGLEYSGDRYEWIMLLDQDSVFDDSFIEEASQVLPGLDEPVAAAVPKVAELKTGRVVSPSRITSLGRFRPVSPRETGNHESLTAINAGAFLRTSALRSIGGFPADYPIDMLAHVVFMRLGRAQREVRVLDATIYNEISLSDMAAIDPARYANILESYGRFWNDYGNAVQRASNRMFSMYRMARLLALGRTDLIAAIRERKRDGAGCPPRRWPIERRVPEHRSRLPPS